ncbi:MAG: hypothetical protein A2Y35_10575 [Spirochaetes bacterium GWE1_60_18]|nr:MAG: hypothetical protein A2Y35_10575 [Spirochaetes bacterium GWE1_60_18]OHD61201.1 MAG: hypothetical protein A2Y32_12870 [Spirochaetes bacterium GWF1_60_12]HAW85212.1 hypothetical protein [Spirochaetaceae bacterium]
MWRTLLAVLALAWCLGQAAAEDLFQVQQYYADTPLLQRQLPTLVATAQRAVADRYLPFYPEQRSAGLRPFLSVIVLEESRLAVIQASRPDGLEEQVNLYWADLAELEALLPPVLFSLWARQHGLADHWRTEPPQASFEVSLHALSPLLAPGLQLQQPIATIAPAPGGGIFAAGLGYVASLDSALQLRATWQPDATDPSLFFYYMTTSATGTLYSMTSSGQGWLLRRGAEGFERFSGIQPLPPAITAAPTGDLVYYDYTAQNFIKISGRRRVPFQLAGTPPLVAMAYTFDDDGAFWLYDNVAGMVKTYAPDGQLLAAVRLLAGPDAPDSWLRLHLRGTDLILSGQHGLAAYDRHGLPLWRLPPPAPQADPLMTASILSSAVDNQGALYVLLSTGLTVTRFDDDRTRSLVDEALAERMARLIGFNAAVRAEPEDEAAYVARLAYIQAAGLGAMELSFRAALGDAFPANRANQVRLTELLRQIDRDRVLTEAARVYGPLRDLGVESARAAFQAAMRNFERYLAGNPSDNEVRQDMLALQEAFRSREDGASVRPPQHFQLEARLGPVFPAFMARYRVVPIGQVVVTNPGPLPLNGLSLEFFIKDFMDFPLTIDYDGTIAPGGRVELAVRPVFNRSLLELRETTGVVAAITAVAITGQGDAVGQLRQDLDILSRTALTWEDSAALAAFITPNDDAVVAFAHAAITSGAPPLFGRNFSRAFALVSALGARGLVYIEDPQTPFSAVGGRAMLDTVRLPRTTLQSGAGDCDDTTALLASCLEAAGVPTAIVTTPGHVMLAFAADGPPSGSGRYQSAVFGSIEQAGRYWIPLETTVLTRGFAEAWRIGWQTIQQAGTELELVSLEVARAEYPALPLAGSPSLPPLPSAEAYRSLAGNALTALSGNWLSPLAQTIERAATGRPRAIVLNDLAMRQNQFGQLDAAIASLRRALGEDPLYDALHANLVMLLNRTGREAEARQQLALAIQRLPGSANLQRLQARLGPTADDSAGTRLVDLNTQVGNPQLGQATTATEVGSRASAANSEPELLWSEGN